MPPTSCVSQGQAQDQEVGKASAHGGGGRAVRAMTTEDRGSGHTDALEGVPPRLFPEETAQAFSYPDFSQP